MRNLAVFIAIVCSAVAIAADPLPLRLQVTKNGDSLQTDFDAFLAKVIAHFDADGDGQLAAAEVQRVFPFPQATGKLVALELAAADTSADGKVDLKELKTWCNSQQIMPLTQATAAATADDLRLAAIFTTAMDPDGNGIFEPTELRSAARRLQQYDLNDDEALELKELLAAPRQDLATTQSKGVAEGIGKHTLQLNLGDQPSASVVSEENVQLGIEQQRFVYSPNSPATILMGRLSRELPNLNNVTQFLVAQLEGAANSGGLKKSAVMNDESLAGLRDLFAYADRNNDQQLTAAELRNYCELIAEGLMVRYYVVLQDRGRNWFSFLDVDDDQRLSAKELTQLRNLPRTENGELAQLVELDFRSLSINAWGGVPIPPLARKKNANVKPKVALPAWFVSQDRNGDYYLSRREFLGPTSVFDQFDANADDLIDATEATKP